MLLILALLAYPLLVFFGLDKLGPGWLAALLGALLLARGWVSGALNGKGRKALAVAALALFLSLVALSGDERLLKAYPAVISGALFAAFAWSLRNPPTIPERLMRITGREVPAEAAQYLRGVTMTWCGFFLVNGAVAAWTALQAPLAWWALYNGLLSYLLIGLLFALEFAVRTLVKRRHASQRHG